jgi:hypothetical protein
MSLSTSSSLRTVLQVSDMRYVTAIVLTMSREPADNDALPSVIVNAAQRLERGQVPNGMFGIQFVQIGTDEDAAAALRALDDHLEKEYKIRVCSMLISRWWTHPYIAY